MSGRAADGKLCGHCCRSAEAVLTTDIPIYAQVSYAWVSRLQEFGEEKVLVHSGILASADWLYDRMYCVALVSCAPAFQP